MVEARTARIVKQAAKPGFSFLRKEEREAHEREIAAEKSKMREAKTLNQAIDGSLVNSRIKSIEQTIEEYAPPEVSPKIKDELVQVSKDIVEEVRQGMLSEEVMRRNPPRAVQHNLDWSAQNKKKILAWKNLQKVIHRDSEDPDLCNFEVFRPSEAYKGGNMTSTFMPDAQIGGHLAFSEAAKENFPESMGQQTNSALQQVIEASEEIEDAEVDEMLARFEEDQKSGTDDRGVQIDAKDRGD